MRLPGYLTELSPVGETLDAIAAGEAVLSAQVEEKGREMALSTAGEAGLSLWEADYGLPDRTGGDQDARAAAVRAAMAAGRTLTPEALREISVALTGADGAELEEAFAAWRVYDRLRAKGHFPKVAALETALERLKPAHLEIIPYADVELERREKKTSALHGGASMEGRGDDSVLSGVGRRSSIRGGIQRVMAGTDSARVPLGRAAVQSGGVLAESGGDDGARAPLGRVAAQSGGMLAEIFGS